MTTALADDTSAAATELRVSERFSCDVPVNCQPPSSFGGGGVKWSAQIRDVGASGLRLILRRRFERGATLAIDLPSEESSTPRILLARVVRVSAEAGGAWALGCSFVSALSDDELLLLRSYAPPEELAPTKAVHPSAAKAVGIDQLLVRARLSDGRVTTWRVRRMAVNVAWPLREGSAVQLRLHFPWGYSPPTPVTVLQCRHHDGHWVLDCSFVGTPRADFLRPLV